MKNHLIFSLFIVSILALCGCTVDAAGGQLSADAETPKSLALGNLGHDSDMVYVEGGTFWMGSTKFDSEKLVHRVTVSSFYMSKYEVTQAEYAAVMGKNPSHFKGKQQPVERVTWYDAVKYCNERSKVEKLMPCYTINGNNVALNQAAKGYRLPTEAEWEYAARGGIHESAFEYSGSDDVDEVAWYWENSGETTLEKTTHEIGKKKANALGLYDMSGNVWEWCWDWYGDYRGNAEKDPLGPASGGRRVIRGGCWNDSAVNCRCANRFNSYPSYGIGIIGFRVVRSADQ